MQQKQAARGRVECEGSLVGRDEAGLPEVGSKTKQARAANHRAVRRNDGIEVGEVFAFHDELSVHENGFIYQEREVGARRGGVGAAPV